MPCFEKALQLLGEIVDPFVELDVLGNLREHRFAARDTSSRRGR